MLSALALGLILGVLSGIVPSLGSASIMLVSLPILLKMDPVHAMYAYLALVVSSQYLGSVTAIYTGIPGTEASVPTAREFSRIRQLGLTSVAIVQNAQASIVGNIIGLGLFVLTINYLPDIVLMYKNSIKLAIIIGTFLIICLINDNKIRALISILLGCFLVSLGYDPNTFETFNLGLSFLDSGLSWVSLLMGSLVGGALIQIRKIEADKDPIAFEVMKGPRVWGSITRGGFIGFIVGFVPGLSYILSASTSYLIERRILKSYDPFKRTLGSIAASESAQSSGSVAMLVPFLLFSIPITAGEGVIMNIVTIHTSLDSVFYEITKDIPTLIAVFVGINLISFLLALSCRRLVRAIFSIPLGLIQLFLVVSGFIAIYFASDYGLVLNMITYVVLIALFFLSRLDPLPFIMSVLLYPTLYTSFYLFKELS